MPGIDKHRLIRSVCRESFYDFVEAFWSAVVPETLVSNWHLEVIAEELQAAAELVFAGKPREHDLVINVPPGTSKSTLVSILFPAWLWTRMPTARCLTNSYASGLAYDLAVKSRDVILCEKYRKCFPEIELRYDQNVKSYFRNLNGGMRYSSGTSGGITGFHGHFLITDDPVDPAQASSPVETAAVNRFLTATLPSRKVDKEVSLQILVMQRLGVRDPTGVKLELAKASPAENPVRHICLPAEKSPMVSPPELAELYTDGLLDTNRLGRSALKSQQVLLGARAYSAQYGQNPLPGEGGQFQTDRIVFNRTPPPPTEFARRIRYWDNAATYEAGCYTTGVLMGLRYREDGLPEFWVLDVERFRLDSHARNQRILRTANLDGRAVKIGSEQEPGGSGKESAQNLARLLSGFTVELDRPSADKVTRADPLSTQVNAGNVFLRPAPWNAAYIEELSFFPDSTTYKDQVDASSGAFNYLTRKRARFGVI